MRGLGFGGWGLVIALCAGGCDEKKGPNGLPEKSADQLDREAIEDLRRSGRDPNQEQTIRHVLLFATEAKMQDAGIDLAKAGYQIRMKRNRTAPPDREFLLLAEAPLVPSLENLRAARAQLGEVARNHGGTYDGWELELGR